MSSPSPHPILITGAGPTGITLALWLHKFGVPFRIIDRLSGPGLTSRAMVVHARALEAYEQLGIAERIVNAGIKMTRVSVANGGVRLNAFDVTDGASIAVEKMSKFPFLLSLPQDIHEEVLAGVLTERGVGIERNVELIDVTQDEEKGHVEAKLRHKDGHDEDVVASYVVGCDGAHSVVRSKSGIKMEGGTYSGKFFVSDVDIVPGTTPAEPDEINMNTSASAYCMLIPTLKHGNARLIGFVPSDKQDKENLTFDDVQFTIKSCLPKLEVTAVKWFSHYKVHHLAAEHFRAGRLFLCGDAGHLHSPMGGQGMNTGIGDATNLAWKLAGVLSGRANEALLDTYEPERLTFAQMLVDTTDAAFSLLTDPGAKGWLMREFGLPFGLPAFLEWKGISFWEAVSQKAIHYRPSPLSNDSTGVDGKLTAGNRLAYVGYADGRNNYEALEDAQWQMHVYGEVKQDISNDFQAKGFQVKNFEFTNDAAHEGLREGALYLIRPDGYVGAVAAANDADSLLTYIAKWGLNGGS